MIGPEGNLDHNHPLPHSHLFTLRLWLEDMGNGQTEWRGKVQHVTSGATRYIRDWAMLSGVVLALLPKTESREETECTEETQ